MTELSGETIEWEEGWKRVKDGIKKLKEILEQTEKTQFSSGELKELYNTIDKMCSQVAPNYCQQLRDKYKEVLDQYLKSTVLPSLKEKHDEVLLRELVYRWENHKGMIEGFSLVFCYLEWCCIHRGMLPFLNHVGLTCFQELVYNVLKEKFRDAAVALIDQERDGNQIDRALLKKVSHFFVEIGIEKMDCYENDFEEYMLEDTGFYYSRKASDWIFEYSCPEYMLKAEEALRREKERVSHYLHSTSETKVLKKAARELLMAHINQLVEKEDSGCRVFLRDKMVDDLSRMYRLFHLVPKGLVPIANMFKQHVTEEGMVLVKQVEEASKNKVETVGGSGELVFVTNIIELHDKYTTYVTNCFSNNSQFHKVLKEPFKVFCNKVAAGCSSVELLASYCDNVLKKVGSKMLSDEAIEDTLDKVMELFAYISEKDLFAEFYRKKLSRRLLFKRNAISDHEKLILTKLKEECGGQFTSNMEGMVTDVTFSRDIRRAFQEHINGKFIANSGIDFTVDVLTTGFWPTYKSFDLSLPAEMCVEVFKQFYLTKTNPCRKLTWVYSLGTCYVNGKFDSKTIVLVVGTYQAAALLLFNTSDRLSYSEIETRLNLSKAADVLRVVLQSLSCSKYRIPKKEPFSKRVLPEDIFEFNSTFTE